MTKALPRKRTEDRIPLQVANSVILQDASDPVKNFPLAISATPTRIVVPDGCLVFIASCDVAWRFGTDATVDDPHRPFAAGLEIPIGLADTEEFWVRTESGSGVLACHFVD